MAPDDSASDAGGRRGRGRPRSEPEVELSRPPTGDPDGIASPDVVEAPPAFDDLYEPDVLAAIDAGARAVEGPPVTPVASWRRRSAMGAVLTGLALGLKEVFEPDDEAQIVVEVDDEGLPSDLPVRLFLDPDSPAGSLCIVHRTDVPPPVV